VHLKRFQCGPAVLALVVLLAVGCLRLANPDILERLERSTYDLRVREAQKYPDPIATNLAFVRMDDASIAAIRHGLLGKPGYGLYWPRQVYGRVVEELSAQGAKCVAFDVLFADLRPDHPLVQLADGGFMESDDFFAVQMRKAGNVISAFTPEITPPDLFGTNSLLLGDISAPRDSDGVLRQLKSFNIKWHPVFRSAARQLGVDLQHARIEPDRIVLPVPGGTPLTVNLDRQGNFDLVPFVGDKIPAPFQRFEKPFSLVWDLGVVLAARELGLDLEHAEVDLTGGKIVLVGPHGITRTLPVDANGCFYINWQLAADDPRLMQASITNVLIQDKLRLNGRTNGLRDDFRNRLVVIGSTAQGNDLSDRGATPLANDTMLVSKHWNVANSIITGKFIHRTSRSMDLGLLAVLGGLTTLLTWGLRALAATFSVVLLLAGYAALAFAVFINYHWWLPMIYPLAGAVIFQHVALVTHRVVFEEQEKRRVRSVFSKVVSPNVVNELLRADVTALNGARRELTVFFADVRGFTALTDQAQEQIAEFIRHSDVDEATAEKYFEESAREMLETVNLYLAAVADVIKQHGGTLDKYIGDCVMAFWNAPTPNERHALAAVQAAVDAQRAILALNEQRQERNSAREIDNRARVMAGLPPRPLHVSLQLGTGINTGLVTVGLMGSDQHILNYTVFGREVNLASRLESHSGSGRIIISDTTYNHLLRDKPELAATCVELFPVKPKGFLNPVRIYEVPWQFVK
jgi:class 3 adenylate cyclase/CHASE2 domain-containing sensor protein